MRKTLCLMTIAALAMGAAVPAAAADPIEGSWSGAGTVRLKDGTVEPVRCRVKYEDGGGNQTFVLYANCATTANTFQQDGRVVFVGGSRYTGRLYSNQYDVSGDVTVSVAGKRQTVSVSSPKGSASITLNKQ